jgi:hypothetical protein
MLTKLEILVRTILSVLSALLCYVYGNPSTWPHLGGLEGKLIKFLLLTISALLVTLFIRYVIFFRKQYVKDNWLRSLWSGYIISSFATIFLPHIIA